MPVGDVLVLVADRLRPQRRAPTKRRERRLHGVRRVVRDRRALRHGVIVILTIVPAFHLFFTESQYLHKYTFN